MPATPDGPIAIYYEHPDWFKPLFAELDRRGLQYERIDAASHSYDPSESTSPYSLVFNRASPSAYLRGHGQVTFHTQSWLRHLERVGVPVVNGAACYGMETSKALQLDILQELGLPYPRARVINNAELAGDAARGLRFPVIVKANIGGSGAGITRFDTPANLQEAALTGRIDLGVDRVALVQELAPLRDDTSPASKSSMENFYTQSTFTRPKIRSISAPPTSARQRTAKSSREPRAPLTRRRMECASSSSSRRGRLSVRSSGLPSV